MPKEMTEKQAKVLRTIIEYRNNNQNYPTVRDLAKTFRSSAGTIQLHLRALEKKDKIYMIPRIHRNIRLKEDVGTKEKIIKIINKAVNNEVYKITIGSKNTNQLYKAYEEAGAFHRLVEIFKKEFNIKDSEINVRQG